MRACVCDLCLSVCLSVCVCVCVCVCANTKRRRDMSKKGYPKKHHGSHSCTMPRILKTCRLFDNCQCQMVQIVSCLGVFVLDLGQLWCGLWREPDCFELYWLYANCCVGPFTYMVSTAVGARSRVCVWDRGGGGGGGGRQWLLYCLHSRWSGWTVYKTKWKCQTWKAVKQPKTKQSAQHQDKLRFKRHTLCRGVNSILG